MLITAAREPKPLENRSRSAAVARAGEKDPASQTHFPRALAHFSTFAQMQPETGGCGAPSGPVWSRSRPCAPTPRKKASRAAAAVAFSRFNNWNRHPGAAVSIIGATTARTHLGSNGGTGGHIQTMQQLISLLQQCALSKNHCCPRQQ